MGELVLQMENIKMICKMCRGAGNANSNGDTGSASVLHAQCEGDCTCQHKVGSGYVVKDSKATLMRTQSP
jgi:hypothetical protein